MQTLKYEVFKSLGGPSAHLLFRTQYFMRTNTDIAAPVIRTQANQVVDVDAGFTYDSIHFNEVKVTVWDRDEDDNNDDRYVSIKLNRNGSRALGAHQLLPLDKCLKVGRNVAFGRGGIVLYRGALSEADVVRQADGTEALAAGVGLAPLGNFAFPAADGVWVMPQHRLEDASAARPIVSFTLLGLQDRQTEVKRVSLASAESNLYQRRINLLNVQVRKIIGRTPLGDLSLYVRASIRLVTAKIEEEITQVPLEERGSVYIPYPSNQFVTPPVVA